LKQELIGNYYMQKDAQKEEEAWTWSGTGTGPGFGGLMSIIKQRIRRCYPLMSAGGPPIETAASC